MNRLIITDLTYPMYAEEPEKSEKIYRKIISSVFSEQELIEVNIWKEEQENILGNIYLGKVKNIVKNINSAFVEIGKDKICYLALEEKEAGNAIFSNPKKNRKINVGDELLVQVVRENVKTKAPVATCNLTLTGKYVVLIHGKTGIGISTKIVASADKKRLRRLVSLYKNDEWGLIIRTNGAVVAEEELMKEIEYLKKEYDSLIATSIHKQRFSLLYKAPAGYICDIRDGYLEEVDEIVTDNKDLLEEIISYLKNSPQELTKVRFYEDSFLPLHKLYSLEQKLKKALSTHVWLNSGGYLVIEPTEALTVIDVNTGKAITGKKNVQDTFFRINKEAAVEIAKQLRLRNLSGIIVVDFIDMQKQEYKDEIMEILRIAFRKDSVKTVLVDMTALNLVEITRKKVRKPLYEQINR